MTVTPALLYRLGAVSVVAAFPLNLAGGLLHPVVDGAAHSVPALSAPINPLPHVLLLSGTLLLMLGVPALYAWVAAGTGMLGLVAYVTYFLSSVLVAFSHLVIEAFVSVPFSRDPATVGAISGSDTLLVYEPYVILQTVSGLVFMGSMILFGIALIRSRAVPVWIGALMAAGGVVLLLPIPAMPGVTGLVVEIPRGCAFAAIGLCVLSATRRNGLNATPPTPGRAVVPTPSR